MSPQPHAASAPSQDERGPATTPKAGQDRGISPIAGRLGGRSGRTISLGALAAGCAVFLFATWDRGDEDDAEAPVVEPARQLAPFEPARRSEPPTLAGENPTANPLAPGDEAGTIPALETTPKGEPSPPSGLSPAQQRRALAESAQRAPLLAYSRTGSGSARPEPSQPSFAQHPSLPGTETPLDQLRRLSPIGRAKAGRLPDRNRLITAGTALPCVLQTAMDSGTPGYVSCVLGRDVYSDSGAVVLMERGTRVLGEYQGGLDTGRRRLFVLWTRAVTPTGVAVALASPAADDLGRSGFDGSVDTRFWERFGGALLLSIVDEGVHAAARKGSDPSSGPRLPSDAPAVALESALDIPPILRKPQGAEVSIFVAQDLDFSEVYSLRSR